MSRHLGDKFRRANGQEWSLDDQDADYRPVHCSGEAYRYRVTLEYTQGLPREEVYAAGEAITEELGLTPIDNNDPGSADMGRPAAFGSGSAEGRYFEITGDDAHIEVRYKTRCSDHHTMQETRERFAEEHRQEFKEQNPGPSELLEREENEQENDD